MSVEAALKDFGTPTRHFRLEMENTFDHCTGRCSKPFFWRLATFSEVRDLNYCCEQCGNLIRANHASSRFHTSAKLWANRHRNHQAYATATALLALSADNRSPRLPTGSYPISCGQPANMRTSTSIKKRGQTPYVQSSRRNRLLG
ncbi:hypothetical protein G5I_01894 [Acromyrmex echinatior]|uniref:Uncharacterized protein n=1 Tax=Acromyrmex echinatior TaxID=103372 RepID=F4W8V1_ACREC|nr:hypothetical protein G5I_01894 [Acromyrmex echinatior]